MACERAAGKFGVSLFDVAANARKIAASKREFAGF